MTGHVQQHRVEQTGVGELTGQIAAAQNPDVAIACRRDQVIVQVGDCAAVPVHAGRQVEFAVVTTQDGCW